MVRWIVKYYVKKKKLKGETARYKVSRILSWCGIFFNTLLFAAKYLIGLIVGSVSIKADAVNNLTDSISNVVSILSFHLAEKPADKEHPFGHERTEAIAALFMGMLIVYLGIEMLRQSISKIMHPSPVHFEWAAVIVLVLSILVKLYMFSYNRRFGRKYDSELLEANALDSRNDAAGTALVLLSTLLSPVIGYDLDGWVGLITAGIIFSSAWSLLHDVISTLLGQAPSADELNELVDHLMESEIVVDVHDVAVHTYGPHYKYATAHVEVDGTLPLIAVHEEMDRLERNIQDSMNIEMVTHVDPVLLHDPETIQAEEMIYSLITSVDDSWGLHDFQPVKHSDGTKSLYFDLIVPYDESRPAAVLNEQLTNRLPDPDRYELSIRVVHPFS